MHLSVAKAATGACATGGIEQRAASVRLLLCSKRRWHCIVLASDLLPHFSSQSALAPMFFRQATQRQAEGIVLYQIVVCSICLLTPAAVCICQVLGSADVTGNGREDSGLTTNGGFARTSSVVPLDGKFQHHAADSPWARLAWRTAQAAVDDNSISQAPVRLRSRQLSRLLCIAHHCSDNVVGTIDAACQSRRHRFDFRVHLWHFLCHSSVCRVWTVLPENHSQHVTRFRGN